MNEPLITNDAIVLGLFALILGGLFYLRSLGGRWDRFFTFVPIILLCYLLPSLLNTAGVISSKESQLWDVAKDYFLPAALILLTLSIDLKAILGLGPKALIMFLTATVGIIIGGPLAVLMIGTIDPATVGGEGADATWRGLSTLAGSWIGGGANQTAMLEIYGYNPERYAAMVAVDIIVANVWMAILLYGAGNPAPIDRWLKADTTAIDRLRDTIADYSARIERPTTVPDLMALLAVALGGVGLSHLVASIAGAAFAQIEGMGDTILANDFFWIAVTSTTVGLSLSFTRARGLEGAGASKIGTVFIFLLVTIIGAKMDVLQIADQPLLFLLGFVWMTIHALLLIMVAKLIRAPFFFVAIGSKANVGGAASAPVLAAAFHPALAPVAVLLAVLGYALGTYGAILCAELMRMVVG
ncbi:DUF819 family protein [Altererythrobacter arenosus]|uniref:DUF819 family protein n=1 Tax=Altererythrobacter arenosus TaxID=3032592 RepID=A0ABY8FTY7_9SPHN|nr:DUF819 family protein [Altererythrobacter sp. CAU 1644]WFL77710.1 DUF819 family protein [Altererythrobacter sp. CAU 1644]